MIVDLSGNTARLFALGRAMLASLFVLGGINKLLSPAASIAMMKAAGVPAPGLLIWAVIALELGGGLMVALGTRWHGWAALALIGHTALINLLLHSFWALEGAAALTQLSLFFKNLSVMGGLAMVAALAFGGAKHR